MCAPLEEALLVDSCFDNGDGYAVDDESRWACATERKRGRETKMTGE